MRTEFIKCFVAKIVGKSENLITAKDMLAVAEMLKTQNHSSLEIYNQMLARDLFLDKEEKMHMSYYELMCYCLNRWEEPNPEKYINQHYKNVKRNELIYWTIVLKKNAMFCGDANDLLLDFLDTIQNDYEPENCENGESAILYYVLQFNKSLEIWEALLRSWNSNKKKYLGEDVTEGEEKDEEDSKILYLNFADKPSVLNYSNLKKFVDVGLSNIDQKTEKSIQEIEESISGLIDKKDETDIEEIFESDLLEHIGNCQKRRKWYVFRLMEQIIDYQIKEFILLVKEYQEKTLEFNQLWNERAEEIIHYYSQKQEREQDNNGNRRLFKVSQKYKWIDLKENIELKKDIERNNLGYSLMKNRQEVIWYQNLPLKVRECIEKLISLHLHIEQLNEELRESENELWIQKSRKYAINGITGSWKEFCDNEEEVLKVKKEDLEKALKESRIVPRRISKCFSNYFDGLQGVDTNAMHKYGPRYNSYLEYVPGFDGENAKIKEVEMDLRPGEQQIRNLLVGKKEVKREMLLLVGLVHKAILGNQTQLSYLKGHVLYYSRYSMDFRNNDFEMYVKKAYEEMHKISDKKKRVETLKKLSMKMEMQYLLGKSNQERIAIFSYIMSVNEV